ncbi:hypothetical protein ABA31_26430 [Agrococcus baldri]|uniref:Uncharacterized protein n=1 Tax=Agrococcus baldri TaxID=153730 RepID=A0AA87REL1_9MICO|nr:hypothetical protein ABA31_26430 [Agrococcus baldri]
MTAFALLVFAGAPIVYFASIFLLALFEMIAAGAGMLYALPTAAVIGMIGTATGHRWARWLLVLSCAAGIAWVAPWGWMLRDLERDGGVSISETYEGLSLSWAVLVALAGLLLLLPSVGRWQAAVRADRRQRRAAPTLAE